MKNLQEKKELLTSRGILEQNIEGEKVLGYYTDYKKTKMLTKIEKEELERLNKLININGGIENEYE